MLTNIAARTKFIFQLKYNINKLLNQSIISKKLLIQLQFR